MPTRSASVSHRFLDPRAPGFQRSRDELVGLVQGVLADGFVSEQEAEFVRRWIEQNELVRTQWPANVLYARLAEMLADGVLDPAEQRELLGTLVNFMEDRERAMRGGFVGGGVVGGCHGVSIAFASLTGGDKRPGRCTTRNFCELRRRRKPERKSHRVPAGRLHAVSDARR